MADPLCTFHSSAHCAAIIFAIENTLDFKVLIRIRYQSPLKTEKKLKSCNFPRDYLTAIERTTAKHAETKRFELLIVCIFIPNM